MSQLDLTPPTYVRGDGDGFSIDVELSEPLQPGPVNLANWMWRVSNTAFECFEAIATGNRIFLQGADTQADPGPDQISYNPPPYDVLDLAGNPLATILQAPLNT